MIIRGTIWRSKAGSLFVADRINDPDDGPRTVRLRSLRHGVLMTRRWTETELIAAGAEPTGAKMTHDEIIALAERTGSKE